MSNFPCGLGIRVDPAHGGVIASWMRETRHRLRSERLDNEREIRVLRSARTEPPSRLVVFLDAELYRERMNAVARIHELDRDPDLPASLWVLVSYGTLEARWVECPCHPPFASFMRDELMPWLSRLHPEASACPERVLVGVSYTGLAASYVALRAPELFTAVISQSGSYWWNEAWLTREFARLTAPLPVRFYLQVGRRETQTNVRHKEDVLQVLSQIDAVRGFRDALNRTGHEVVYREFDGAHDSGGWAQVLPEALRWALQRR